MSRAFPYLLVVLALALLLGVSSTALAADTAKGKIKEVDGEKNTFVVTDKDDKDHTFTMDESGKIQLNDKDVKLKELKKGDVVEVEFKKDGDKLIATKITCKREKDE